jgi:hypothetical protein
MIHQAIAAFVQNPGNEARRNRNVARIALLLGILILLRLGAFTDTVWAGPPEIEIEMTPASVEIGPDETVEVLVVVRNHAADELRDVQLSWFTNVGLEVQVEHPASNVLVPYGTLTWTLQLSHVDDQFVEGNVHLRVDYIWQGEGETDRTPCVAIASLEIGLREPQAVEKVAEITIETALESLNEHRPGIVYVVVSNITDVPIQITEISSDGPSFVSYSGPEQGQGVTLAPGEDQAFSYRVTATGPVRPGKHLLIFEVSFEWQDAGRVWTRRDLATHELEVGVFGESGILTAVGVPSFLILPGFLMFLTASMLWRFVEPRTEFPLKVKSAEAGLIAVTLSLLVAIMYPVVTGWSGARRNYLEGYELTDVMWVWFGSVAIAAAGYFLVVGGRNLVVRLMEAYKAWAKHRLVPSTGDTPITVLRKLHRQGLGLELIRVDVKIGEELQRGYLLEPKEEDQELVWIGPSIIVEWLAGVEAEIHKEVEEQLSPKGSPATLATLLEENRVQGHLRVWWKQMGRLDGPCQVEVANIQKYIKPTIIVEQE